MIPLPPPPPVQSNKALYRAPNFKSAPCNSRVASLEQGDSVILRIDTMGYLGCAIASCLVSIRLVKRSRGSRAIMTWRKVDGDRSTEISNLSQQQTTWSRWGSPCTSRTVTAAPVCFRNDRYVTALPVTVIEVRGPSATAYDPLKPRNRNSILISAVYR